MALASPVDYAGSITSGQKDLGCFRVPGCNRLRCLGYAKQSRAATQLVVRAVSVGRPLLDFSNPDWKKQFQEDFDRQFSLSHLGDIIDVEPRPTTFSLKCRTPLENVNGSLQETWNGYVNDDDRALLKGAPCWPKQIYFEPHYLKAGIVTCGGLCPGLNGAIWQCHKRKLKVSTVGFPKTIDNDILLMDKKFGFDTAVDAAQRAINSAYIEAHPAFHGIGLVKLMGRSSRFITMHASLSSGQVDICLIPEVHGAFAGFSGITTGVRNTHVFLPIQEVIKTTRFVDPDSWMWHRCFTLTGQPDFH